MAKARCNFSHTLPYTYKESQELVRQMLRAVEAPTTPIQIQRLNDLEIRSKQKQPDPQSN